MRRNREFSLASKCSIFILLLVMSCASAYQTFYVVDTEFTAAVTSYNIKYEAASPTLQAKWNKEIDPLILQANTALDVWQASLAAGDSKDKAEIFLALKSQIFTLFQKYDIIKVTEE
jgi:hypothetical protein